jgi:hypothetical protein
MSRPEFHRLAILLDFTYRHGRREVRGQSRLEVRSYVGTDDWENPSAAAAKSLEKIAKAAEAIVAKSVARRQTDDEKGLKTSNTAFQRTAGSHGLVASGEFER